MIPIQKILPFSTIFGIILVSVGIYFLCRTETNSICTRGTDRIKIIDSKVVDYTHCINGFELSCREEILKGRQKHCQCSMVEFTLNSSLPGEVIVFYQLDTFSGTSIYNGTNYTLSRDDQQLLGDLTNAPSNSCIPYAYGNDGTPIAPCGAIADAMYTDELMILDQNIENYPYIPRLFHGIVSDADKKNYRNPPNSSEDLATVFKNYSRPKSWNFPIWDLDPTNSSNNGFQNEPFIAWMSAKDSNGPIAAWRVNRNDTVYKDGLPAGNYTLIVNYKYHPLRYMGSRKAVIASTEHEYDPDNCTSTTTRNHFDLGISSLIIGIIFLLISIAAVVYGKKTNWGKGEDNTIHNDQRPSSTNCNGTRQQNGEQKPLQSQKYQITDNESLTATAAVLRTTTDDD
ncbi:cell cycle control protein 50A-like [Hyposmocoma kahamanoa]|uniref:cell cycle control protein 50A-like n=1 Tax=Hyposmocoma kahamanoa TaxID=1477025 RepID=UPI000E6D694C|nr:cell cycle control protein 50A-like [Hyposmocoma kahamanoa]